MFYYKRTKPDGFIDSIVAGVEKVQDSSFIEITEEEYNDIRKQYNMPQQRKYDDSMESSRDRV